MSIYKILEFVLSPFVANTETKYDDIIFDDEKGHYSEEHLYNENFKDKSDLNV